jgi:uncharacterized protein YdhG (YjbR/CyaY superfamily)
MDKVKDIESYIAAQHDKAKVLLQKLRQTIKKAAPEAVEVISYNMPAFKYHGMLVYYAGYKNHIGFYPTSAGIKIFADELSNYKWSKGTIQFPIDQPLPIDLITRIVKFRAKENLEKAEMKKMIKLGPNDFLSDLPAPARRALESEGITTLKKLSKFSEKDLLKLHGIGPGSIPKLKSALENNGLSFKK